MATIIPYCRKHKIYGRCFLCEVVPPRDPPLKRKPKADDDGFLHEMTNEQIKNNFS